MNSFINNLVSRHIDTFRNIKPRLRGIFDTELRFSNILADEDSSVSDTWANENPSAHEIDRPTPVFPGLLPDQIEEKVMLAPAEPISLLPGQEKIKIKTAIDKQQNDGSFVPINEEKKPRESVPLPIHPTLESKDLQSKHIETIESVIKPDQDKAEDNIEKDKKSYPEKKIVINESQKKPLEKIYFYSFRNEMDKMKSVHQIGELTALNDKLSPNKIGQNADVQKNEIKPQDSGYLGQLVVPSQKQDIENTLVPPLISKGSKSVTKKVINVTIGSVEVHAFFPPVEVKTPTQKENKNMMSLDQFLDERNQAIR